MRKRHVSWAALPVLAFLATPFLPFVNGPHLWLGLPSVLVWAVVWTIGCTVALYAIEKHADHPEDAEDDALAETAAQATAESERTS
ncbi:hypothetical protein [Streptomyces sp. SID3343]|uniref:hypothetical protein n=1 Tax=Streptomyces sp. SID3343 TaxID=2690260 RepID=UPI0013C0F481|nr:hypothetical protein [Streptomyces sp. SID3343]MYW06678.1 hypothetical protein [Streptomyces sp. SID3343]